MRGHLVSSLCGALPAASHKLSVLNSPCFEHSLSFLESESGGLGHEAPSPEQRMQNDDTLHGTAPSDAQVRSFPFLCTKLRGNTFPSSGFIVVHRVPHAGSGSVGRLPAHEEGGKAYEEEVCANDPGHRLGTGPSDEANIVTSTFLRECFHA